MKKIILILLAVLPVLIVFFTALGAVGIISEIKTNPVKSIEIDYEKLDNAGQETDAKQNYINLDKGGELDFREYITVYPAKAKFSSLSFVSAQPDVVDVEGGVLKAKQYMRGYMRISVEVRSGDGLTLFATFKVRINGPKEGEETLIIDYIGFDLSAYLGDSDYSKYCSVEDGVLIIDKKIIDDTSANGTFIILAGLVTGAREAVDAVAETLSIEGDAITKDGEYTYFIVSTGTVIAAVELGGKSATLEIIIR